MKRKIVVVGSCNTDMVIPVEHLPLPGETIIGGDLLTNQGGKGANQAVAVARFGGEVELIARVGDDGFGRQTIESLRREGVGTSRIRLTPGVPSGVALIAVDAKGENSIMVSSGANARLTPEDVEEAGAVLTEADVVLMQLETPLPTLTKVASLAHEAGCRVVLNPAPYPPTPLPAAFLGLIDLITPNETEAMAMSGVSITDEASALEAIRAIRAQGIKQVVITAGGAGAYTELDGQLLHIEAYPTHVVDTTAAGDTFCGVLCVALSEGASLAEAIAQANRAAALSVTRRGAWQSIPYRREVEEAKANSHPNHSL